MPELHMPSACDTIPKSRNMTDALLPRPVQQAEEVSEPEANLARLTGKLSTDRGRVKTYVPLILFAICFAVAARSWVGFGDSVDGGIPVGLFTQTDFPAIVIASRIVASGPAGSELYNPAAQLEGQHL